MFLPHPPICPLPFLYTLPSNLSQTFSSCFLFSVLTFIPYSLSLHPTSSYTHPYPFILSLHPFLSSFLSIPPSYLIIPTLSLSSLSFFSSPPSVFSFLLAQFCLLLFFLPSSCCVALEPCSSFEVHLEYLPSEWKYHGRAQLCPQRLVFRWTLSASPRVPEIMWRPQQPDPARSPQAINMSSALLPFTPCEYRSCYRQRLIRLKISMQSHRATGIVGHIHQIVWPQIGFYVLCQFFGHQL